ncbi:MAG: hybrid sensor histidine kinase/response regulator [Massilia sp.]|nr:hybrid sensor histidine kinase/response regulator [Massilia sp.]
MTECNMPNADAPRPAVPPDTDKIVPGQVSLNALRDEEIAALHDTIGELRATIDSYKGERARSAAYAPLVEQLKEANQNLVLAAFGAQDRQATAEAANMRQTEFLSMLAHELRNPLQPMAMANALLTDLTGLHPNIARVHAVNARQIAHMVRLVDDLLDASRLTCGKITLRLAPVSLSDIIDHAIENSRPGIDRRNQILRVILPKSPLIIEGDLVRLAQVFSNLLINASKFTHEYGHIEIVARRIGHNVEVTIRDDGVGMAPELLPYIFDLFTQGFPSLDRAQGGLGIGLSLVRNIAQLHGGSANASSEGIGKGSRFVIRLPLSGLTPNDAFSEQAGAISPCSILVIEDNDDANDVLSLLLRQDGHSVTSCGDGPSGLRAGLAAPFDIVLCDIGLPGMDGYQVVSAMRAALAQPFPSFVATTGYSEHDQQERAAAAGFDHYLIKPLSLQAINRIIAERRPVRVLPRHSPAEPGESAAP